jgi:hypothetical protein
MDNTDFDFSDDEDMDMSYTEARAFVLRFGKHVHQTVGAVCKTRDGRNYLAYLLSWDKLEDHTRQPIQICVDEYKRASAARVLQNRARVDTLHP